MITLSHGPTNSFSLLPPDMNRADVEVLTQNVVLSTNLVGRWLTPDHIPVTTDTINFPLFHQTDGGLYKFYVTNWEGEQELAIQIYISLAGMYSIHYQIYPTFWLYWCNWTNTIKHKVR